jgi:hypothetical protein
MNMARKTLADLVKQASRRPVPDKPIKQRSRVPGRTEVEKRADMRRRREIVLGEARLVPQK